MHTHNLSGFTSTVWQAVHARGIPLVHTIHDYALLCPGTTMYRRDANCSGQCLGCRVLSWPKREHSRWVNAVVGVSGFALDRHLQGGYFPRAAQYVIQNGDPRGSFPDVLNTSGGTFVYKICEMGTTNCSNTASVTF